MPEVFKLGEIAIIQRSQSRFNGIECEVSGGLCLRLGKTPSGQPRLLKTYQITFWGKAWLCEPDQLRKKRPPRDDLQVVRWASCPWQPSKVKA